MSLIINREEQVFDQEMIQAGNLLYARHKTWTQGQAGFVTRVSDTEIQVQYYPGIRNVTNHFCMAAAEVAAGEWEVRWSPDLKKIEEIRMGGENSA